TGKEIKQLSEDEATKEVWQVVIETPSRAKFPNGEAMLDMQRRVVDALEAIIAAHGDVDVADAPAASQTVGDGKPGDRTSEPLKKRPQVVAIVAHADVIKAALAHYLGMPFDNFQRLSIAPASVSTLAVSSDEQTGKRRILVMNVNQTAP
ncbi:MAG: histidine phosphatase family protein, partial [Thermoflexales bacterium]|nr:histidine phosphatase family protein [Thermoflexales bacterium]